jgi:hypothetical protein
MRILTGPHGGDGYRPHQWANDWITADPPGGGNPVIARPGNVELADEDLERFTAHRQRWLDDRRTGGQFWVHWQLDGHRLVPTEAGQAYLAARRRRPRGGAAPQAKQ